MPHRHGLRTVLFGSLVLTTLGVGCDKDKLNGPEAEVKKTDIKLDLPAVPAFDLPPASPDSHSVKELRVKGKKLLDTEITVKGFITWAYDCPTAIRTPTMTDKDVQKLIADDPTKCERAKFYVGDAADTPVEKSLWIVDVPRPFNKQEIDNGGKDVLKNIPSDRCDPKADAKKTTCPPYKVGDQVVITGDFKMSSPHSERNSDGLLVYKKMENVTQAWTTPPPDPLAVPPGGAPPPTGPAGKPGAKPSPSDLVNGKKKAG